MPAVHTSHGKTRIVGVPNFRITSNRNAPFSLLCLYATAYSIVLCYRHRVVAAGFVPHLKGFDACTYFRRCKRAQLGYQLECEQSPCLLIFGIALGQGGPVQLVDSIKLTPTVASGDWTHFVIGKPTDHMMRMSSMFAAHAPAKPFRKG